MSTHGAVSPPNQTEEQKNGQINRKRIKLSRKLYIQDKNSSPSVVASNGESGVENEHRLQTKQLYIASLHNLGNTCYLNAVLQALRYTPGFVDTIHQLYAAIEAAVDCNWLDDDCLDREIGPLKLVRSLHELFRKMAASEERCSSGASVFISLRPYDLLELIGLLNEDFEGSQQHDAHELLQWLQGALQDAWMRLRDAELRHSPPSSVSSSSLASGTNIDSQQLTTGVSLTAALPSNGTPSVGSTSQLSPVASGPVNGRGDGVRLAGADLPMRSSLKNSPKSEGRSSSSSASSSPAKRVRFDCLDLLHEYVGGNVDAGAVEPCATIDHTIAVLSDEAAALHQLDIDGTVDLLPQAVETSPSPPAAAAATRQSSRHKKGKRKLDALKSCNEVFVNGSAQTLLARDNTQSHQESGKCQPRRSGRLKRERESSSDGHDAVKGDASVAECVTSSGNSTVFSREEKCKVEDVTVDNESKPSSTLPVSANGSSPPRSAVHLLPMPRVALKPMARDSSGSCSSLIGCSSPPRVANGTLAASSPIQRPSRSGGDAKQPSPMTASPGGDHRTYCSCSPSSYDWRPWAGGDARPASTLLMGGRRLSFDDHYGNGYGTTACVAVKGRPFVLSPSVVVLEPKEAVTPEAVEKVKGIIRPDTTGGINNALSIVGYRRSSPRFRSSSASQESSFCSSPADSSVTSVGQSCVGDDDRAVTRAADPKISLMASRVPLTRLPLHTIQTLTAERGMTVSARQSVVQRVTASDPTARLFNGRMTLRTKCLECESSSPRDQVFVDLGVSVTSKKKASLDDGCDEAGRSVNSTTNRLLSCLSHVERLTADNKYSCTTCHHHVEAEISSHYVHLPPILTIHIKRFARMSGGLGKVLDHVNCPRVLDCFRDGCGADCVDVSHRYYLHAIILHVGLSLSCGHYVAFVRAPPPGCFPHQHPSLRRPSVESSTAPDLGGEAAEGSVVDTAPQCRVTRRQSLRGQLPAVREGGEVWYECDDDCIRSLTSADLDSRLSPDGAASPYLLLYHSATWSWSSTVEGHHYGVA